jgi:tubulin alpha
MREILNLGVGQCGIQVYQQVWRLYCLEHNIGKDGKVSPDDPFEDIAFTTFFKENSNGRFVPRTIFADLEPGVCEQIKHTDLKNLFDPESIVYSYENASSVYARGKFTCSKAIHEHATLAVRRAVETCTSLNGIQFIHSSGGGTGTGYLEKLAVEMTDQYGKDQMAFTVQPSERYSGGCVEYLNSTLFFGNCVIDGSGLQYICNFDNEGLYNRIPKADANFHEINSIIAYCSSGLTSGMRYAGDLNCNLRDIKTNLIPYAALRQLIMGFSPLSASKKYKCTAKTITLNAFSGEELVSVNSKESEYIACALVYRGHVSPHNVNFTIRQLQRELKFVPWMPSGFKIGIVSERFNLLPDSPFEGKPSKSLTKICNHGCVVQVFERFKKKFEIIQERRAFYYHYISSGLEEGEFAEANEKLDQVIDQYKFSLTGEE